MRLVLIGLAVAMLGLAACAQSSSDLVVDYSTQGDLGEFGASAGDQPDIYANFAAALGTTDRVFFAFDSATLDQAARDTIRTWADALARYPDIDIVVAGHCDERGSREYNLALGERRAAAVKDLLVALGIDPARIATISYGKEKPARGRHMTRWPGPRTGAWSSAPADPASRRIFRALHISARLPPRSGLTRGRKRSRPACCHGWTGPGAGRCRTFRPGGGYDMQRKLYLMIAMLFVVTACQTPSELSGDVAGGGDSSGGAAGGVVAQPPGDVVTSPQPTIGYLRTAYGDTVLFDYDSSVVRPEAETLIRDWAAWMQQFPSVAVFIEGHCDERGTRRVQPGARRPARQCDPQRADRARHRRQPHRHHQLRQGAPGDRGPYRGGLGQEPARRAGPVMTMVQVVALP